jgi:hypothetical protein
MSPIHSLNFVRSIPSSTNLSRTPTPSCPAELRFDRNRLARSFRRLFESRIQDRDNRQLVSGASWNGDTGLPPWYQMLHEAGVVTPSGIATSVWPPSNLRSHRRKVA